MFLAIAAELGSVEGTVIEFRPGASTSSTIDERSTIATMCAELSAEFAVFPADDVPLSDLAERDDPALRAGRRRCRRPYAGHDVVDLAAVGPGVAAPSAASARG